MPRLGVSDIFQTERAIIVGKLQGCLKQKHISQQHGISPSALHKIKYKIIRTGDVKNLPRSGKPKVTTDAVRYAREILEPHVLPVAGAMDPNDSCWWTIMRFLTEPIAWIASWKITGYRVWIGPLAILT